MKEISQLLKENYKEMIRVKKHLEEELERNDELNNNIIEDNEFSSKDLHNRNGALLDFNWLIYLLK